MRQIEGTATISISELDRLRQYEEWYNELRRSVRRLEKRVETKHTDDYYENVTTDIMTEEQLEKVANEEVEEIKIIISGEELHELVYEYMDDTKSAAHCFVQTILTKEEFGKIKLILE